MKNFSLFTAILVGILSIGSSALAGQFPSVKAENLNEVRMNLPQDFGSRRSIIMVAYTQKQQDLIWIQADEWLHKQRHAFGHREQIDAIKNHHHFHKRWQIQ